MAIPGSNIRLLRREMSLSLEALAEAAGVDPGNLSRVENGKARFSDTNLQRIADVLRVSLEVLYSAPEKVEAAALRMREVPILTPAMLLEWRGPDTLEFNKHQRYLYTEPERTSRYSFGLVVEDETNTPKLCPSDELIFDANKQPTMGKFVVASSHAGTVCVGRLRLLPEAEGKRPFEVVPFDNISPAASSLVDPTLELRGTLIELRRPL